MATEYHINITGLRVIAPIGVMERERRTGNLFEIDLQLRYDASEAVATDDIADALNYAEVTETVKSVMKRPARLIENAAGRIRDAVAAAYPAVTGGSITVTKLHPPIPAPTPQVGFTLTW